MTNSLIPLNSMSQMDESAQRDSNPWLALNPYSENDQNKFHGRDSDKNRLSKAIMDHEISVIYGPSGVGKTSLILAGVFPVLRCEGICPIYIRMAHLVQSEAQNVPVASYSSRTIDIIEEKAKNSKVLLKTRGMPVHQKGQQTLWEFFHRTSFVDPNGMTLCPVLVLDQFEEAFTVGEQTKADKSLRESFLRDLSDLGGNYIPSSVVDALAQRGRDKRLDFPLEAHNWRVVLILRDDYLSRLEDCTFEFPVFSQNRIGISPFTKEQALDVVLRPGEEAGVIDSQETAEKIVHIAGQVARNVRKDSAEPMAESTASETVEPPILSLLCSELYKRRPEEGCISTKMVESHGDDILRTFYQKAMQLVSPQTAEWLEDNLVSENGYRRSEARTDIVQSICKSIKENAPGKEAIASQIENEIEKELDILVERERVLHSEFWDGTKRLEFCHDVLVKYVIESRTERKKRQEQQNAENRLKHELRRQQKRMRLACAALLGLVLLIVCSWFANYFIHKEYIAYYSDFTKVWGAPVGIGKLTSEEVSQRQCSYLLHSKGLRCTGLPSWKWPPWPPNRPYLVEAVCGTKGADGKFLRTTFHPKGAHYGNDDIKQMLREGIQPTWLLDGSFPGDSTVTPEENKIRNRLAYDCGKVCAWSYSYASSSEIMHPPLSETALDMADNPVWQLQYYTVSEIHGRKDTSVFAHFINPKGLPLNPTDDRYLQVTFSEQDGGERDIVRNRASGNKDAHSRLSYSTNNLRIQEVHNVYDWMSGDADVYEWVPPGAGPSEREGERETLDVAIKYCSSGPTEETYYDKPGENKLYRRIREYSPDGNIRSVFCSTTMVDNIRFSDRNFLEDGKVLSVSFGKPADGWLSMEKRFEIVESPSEGITNCYWISEIWTNGLSLPTSISFQDENGIERANRYGIARIVNTFDGNGLFFRQDFYAPSNCPGAFGLDTVHHVAYEYDREKGTVTNVQYYSFDGTPCRGGAGVHEIRVTYDTSDPFNTDLKMTELSFFDEQGEPSANKYGAVKYTLRKANPLAWVGPAEIPSTNQKPADKVKKAHPLPITKEPLSDIGPEEEGYVREKFFLFLPWMMQANW